MAEAAGLAIGVVGLLALANTCIGVIDKVDSGLNCNAGYQDAALMLTMLGVRLSRWKHIHQTELEDDHSEDQFQQAELCLERIEKRLEEAKALGQRYATVPESPPAAAVSARTNAISALIKSVQARSTKDGEPLSLRKKARWALRDETKMKELVDKLEQLITNLEKILPGGQEQREQLTKADAESIVKTASTENPSEALGALRFAASKVDSEFDKAANTLSNMYLQMANYYGPVVQHYHFSESSQPDLSLQAPTDNIHWLVRRRPNTLFTGQEEALKQMEQALLKHPRAGGQFVLQGMGGAGKSELALQVAKKHRREYWAVLFIDCSSEPTARSAFQTVADKCGAYINPNDGIVEQAVEWLSNLKQTWLLILDNCDDPKFDYSSYFPENDLGSIIMTARLEEVEHYAANGKCRLDGLAESSAIELLFKYAGSKGKPLNPDAEEAARSMVRQLGFHALAITVAGSMVKKNIYTIKEYASLLSQRLAELLRTQSEQAKSTYGTIYETFEISAEKLSASADPAAKHALELLDIFAFMDRAKIEEEIFSRAWKYSVKLKQELSNSKLSATHTDDDASSATTSTAVCDLLKSPAVADIDLDEALYNAAMAAGSKNANPTALNDIGTLGWWHFDTAMSVGFACPDDISVFRRARALLRDLSLIITGGDTSVISVHPLVHEWAKRRLAHDKYMEAWLRSAATLALSAEGQNDGMYFSTQVAPHMKSCYQSMPPDYSLTYASSVDTVRMLFLFAYHMCAAKDEHTAQVLETIKKSLLSSDTVPSELVAQVLAFSGEWLLRSGSDPAVTVAALSRAQQVIGALQSHHKLELDIQLLLAGAYCEDGRTLEAVQVLDEVAPNVERRWGSTSDDAIRWKYFLADSYARAVEHTRAINILEEVIPTLSESLPGNIYWLLMARRRLAELYRAAGEAKKSIAILEDTVRICRDLPSNTSYDVAEQILELATSYFQDDQSMRAKEIIDDLASSEVVMSKQQREGLRFLELRFALWEKYGCSDVWYDQADRLESQGCFDEAVELREKGHGMKLITRPADHTECLIDRLSLARLSLKNSQFDRARAHVEFLQMNRSKMREDCRWHLPVIENALTEWEDTGEIGDWFQYFGMDWATLYEYERLGDYTDLIYYLERICEAKQSVGSAHDNDLLTDWLILARLYFKASRGAEAKQLIEHLATIRDKIPQDWQWQLPMVEHASTDWERLGEVGSWFQYFPTGWESLSDHERRGLYADPIEYLEHVCESQQSSLPADDDNLLAYRLALARLYLKAGRGTKVGKLMDILRNMRDKIPEDWQEMFLLLEDALAEWKQTGKVGRWILCVGWSSMSLRKLERQGRFTEAIEMWEKWCKITPETRAVDQAEYLARLLSHARVLLKSSQGNRARELLERVKRHANEISEGYRSLLPMIEGALKEWENTRKVPEARWCTEYLEFEEGEDEEDDEDNEDDSKESTSHVNDDDGWNETMQPTRT